MLRADLTELDEVKLAVAIISTSIADALAETDPAFKDRLVANLDRAYARLRDKDTGATAMDPKAMHDLELLSWARELLTGLTVSTGQGTPFFDQGKGPERFRVEYGDGSHAIIAIDKWTLDRGDHVSRRVAVERQEKGELPKGEITSVKRV